jgi:tetratricopeptide (TPR) repeat protein
MPFACALVLLLGSTDARSPLADALELERAGRDGAAIASLERLIQSKPTWELPRLEAARLRLKVGDGLEHAQKHLEVARKVAPGNPRAHYLWGLLMIERGRATDAADAFELAVRYRQDYHDARFRLAGLYFSEGKWAKAEQHYRALAEAQPEAVSPRAQLAAAIERQGRLDEAEAELRQLLADQPRSAVAVRRLADFYERTGRSELAAQVLKGAEPARRRMRELGKSKR